MALGLCSRRKFSRAFSTGLVSLARTRPTNTNLRLRPPVPPTVHNIETPEDHPLWQFFPGKKFIRSVDEIQDRGRPWSIPELRRKSFDDLHTLWFVCLKERNILAKESHIFKTWGKDVDQIDEFANSMRKVEETMWKIRHVLSERNHAWKNAIENVDLAPVVVEFEENYLAADDASDAEMEVQLERFLRAFFGINPGLEDNLADDHVIQGIYFAANAKLKRFSQDLTDSTVDSAKDINEAFLLYNAEHSPEGIQKAVDTIKTYRTEENYPVAADNEAEVLSKLILLSRQED